MIVTSAALLCSSMVALGADEFHGNRTDDLQERRHHAVLTLSHERAELVVTRAVYNSGQISDEATFMIELPQGAVATRLRTRGTGALGPWFEGELMEAEEAAEKYRELTGIGGYYPKDPALLSWRYQGLLALQVFPCPPRSEKVVEYTLQLPLTYEQGKHHVRLGALGTEGLPARIQVVATNPRNELSVDGKRIASGVVLPPPPASESELDIALAHEAAPLEVALASQSFGGRRVLTHYAVRAAPRLSKAPKHAYVVVVIDASRSTPSGFEQAAKSALGAYLMQLPGANVEVLTFDRQVRHHFGGFGSRRAAEHAISVLALGQRNGSDVERAVFEADQLLSAAPLGSPRRIVLVTDGLTRSSLTPERLRGAIGQSRAVLHVGILTAGAPSLSRDDEHAWASAVRATGGVVWRASAPDEPTILRNDPELRRTYEEWVRPLRIDNISALADDGTLSEKVPTTLAEGEGSQELYLHSSLARSVAVSGELWSSPIRVMARHEVKEDSHWAAIVFGTDLLESLSEPEQMTLALRGRAVSPVTSYLAIEPGVRPSTEGLERNGRLAFGIGLGGTGRLGGVAVSSRAPAVDREAYLREQLEAERRRCGGAVGSASLHVETTLDEIVQVQIRAAIGTLDSAVADCLREAVWALLLPPGFDEDNASFHLDL
jgi:hypothetical protein